MMSILSRHANNTCSPIAAAQAYAAFNAEGFQDICYRRLRPLMHEGTKVLEEKSFIPARDASG